MRRYVLKLTCVQDMSRIYIYIERERERAPPMPPTPYLTIIFGFVRIFDVWVFLFIKNRCGKAREGFKKLPGGGSFVLTEYEPVASHGDPIHVIFYRLLARTLSHCCLRQHTSVRERHILVCITSRIMILVL